ncbi:hypothetical protein [Streptomyces sp. YS-3]|uniref:hypothetical protein n=1 Tax=Streptomyces sp. YS-3 TaxID=3381352 RepID=UPI003862C769
MRISRSRLVVTALLLSTPLTLTRTGCGEEHAGATGSAATRAASPSRSPVGPARGNVEPDSHDGAPHYRENNGFKFSQEMSPAGEKAARAEAARIEPVLKRLWTAKVWDPERVRAALLELGYRSAGPNGEQKLGKLTVRRMDPRFETDHYVTPAGAQIALRIREDACVTAFTQPTNYQVSVNGLYMETGCFEPRGGH